MAFDLCGAAVVILGAIVTVAAGFGLYMWFAFRNVERIEDVGGFGWWTRKR